MCSAGCLWDKYHNFMHWHFIRKKQDQKMEGYIQKMGCDRVKFQARVLKVRDEQARHDSVRKLTFLGEGTGLTLTSSTVNLGGGGRGGTRLFFFLSYTGGKYHIYSAKRGIYPDTEFTQIWAST